MPCFVIYMVYGYINMLKETFTREHHSHKGVDNVYAYIVCKIYIRVHMQQNTEHHLSSCTVHPDAITSPCKRNIAYMASTWF